MSTKVETLIKGNNAVIRNCNGIPWNNQAGKYGEHHLRLGSLSINWRDAKQKTILTKLAAEREAEKTPHEERLTKRFNVTDEEWQKYYNRIKSHSNATRVRDFMLRWLMIGVNTNEDYERYGVKPIASCQYCKFQKQDFEHLFADCDVVKSLRDRLSYGWDGDAMTTKDWLLGAHQGQYDKAKNFIAMEMNRYIHITNWKGEELSLKNFKSTMRGTEFIERRIALSKNKTNIHDRKWSKILQLLN